MRPSIITSSSLFALAVINALCGIAESYPALLAQRVASGILMAFIRVVALMATAAVLVLTARH